jgi:hypothetical protein
MAHREHANASDTIDQIRLRRRKSAWEVVVLGARRAKVTMILVVATVAERIRR